MPQPTLPWEQARVRHAIANPCSVPHHCTECQYALFGACHAHRNLGHSLAVRSIGIGNARCAVRGWKTTARSPTAPTAAACRRMPPQSFLGTLGGVFAARRRTPSHAAALNFDPDHDHDPLLRLQSFNWTGDPEGPFALFWSAPSPSPVSGCGPPIFLPCVLLIQAHLPPPVLLPMVTKPLRSNGGTRRVAAMDPILGSGLRGRGLASIWV